MSDDIKFVRVQDDLHGMKSDADGNLILYYKRDSERNTVHFTVNTIVEDHSYGKFNFDSNGRLKGNVVIIADPSEMVNPAALNQVDTWFRYGISTEGSERFLNIGKATIVVPEGMEVPIGANALFFDGTIEDRNKVVKEHFEKLGIRLESCGFRSWANHGMESSRKWAEDTVAKMYPGSVKDIYIGMHDGSPDSNMECSSVSGTLSLFKEDQSRYYFDGMDISYMRRIKEKAETFTVEINKFLDSLPNNERDRVGKHYEKQLKNLVHDVNEAKALDDKLTKRDQVNYLVELINNFPGTGNFFLAKPGDKEPTIVSSIELPQKILDGSISISDNIWRQGYKAEWTTIKNTELSESIEDIFKNSENKVELPMKNSIVNRISSIRNNSISETASVKMKLK